MFDESSSLGIHLRHPVSSTTDDERDLSAFANGRIGTKPQLTITFRRVSGASHSFAYSHLYAITTEAEAGGFVAEFSQHRVLVEGRNLQHLFRVFCDHKVHTIQETSPSQALGMEVDQPVVLSIRVLSLEESDRAR